MAAQPVVDSAVTNEPWRIELEWEIQDSEAGGVASRAPSILLQLLTASPGDGPVPFQEAAREAARRIDEDYRDVYLPSDPLIRGTDDKGMAGFLWHVYGLVLTAARLVNYDDARQDALVQLLVELRKLPPKPFKIYNEDCLVYTREPVGSMSIEGGWNGNYPYAELVREYEEVHQNASVTTIFKQRCDEWVNYSAFLARSTAQGIHPYSEELYKYPSIDVPLGLGLGKEVDIGELGDCRLMVAVQWLLLCGGSIREHMVETNIEKWNLDKWNYWMAKLEEIEKGGIENAKLKAAVSAALRYIASLAQ